MHEKMDLELEDGGMPSTPTLELERQVERGPWGLEVGFAGGVRHWELRSGQRLVLGSARHADLRVSDRTVSARHARIEVTDEGVVVEDLDSRNGLYVGGARVAQATLCRVGTGFVAGSTTITLRRTEQLDLDVYDELPLEGLVGASIPMRRLARDVRRMAPLRRPVLVVGESGTGKDLVARALHTESRRSGRLVALNVGTIAESLSDTELFGHRRGSFTGAVSDRQGAFVEANGGTLFLDEIAELSPSVQVKLLRVVEDGLVRSVGGGESAKVDVRLVTATWADLAALVHTGKFRADLLHRLSTLTIAVPPLRERLSDLPALCAALLAASEAELGPKRITTAAQGILAAHRWSGNVRELQGVLYRAALRSPGADILPAHLEIQGARQERPSTRRLTASEARELVERYGGNVSAAARAVQVPRSTFRFWLEGA